MLTVVETSIELNIAVVKDRMWHPLPITAIVVVTPLIAKSMNGPHNGKEHEIAEREDHTVVRITGMDTARLTVAISALV
jgi:hypothetical protein